MDPIVIGSLWGWAMYDTLLTFDQQGNVVGNVAEKYNLSQDGLTWTFNIRKGIKFHNGDPLTAADVVFSLQRFGSKESTNPWSPYILKNNESITAHGRLHGGLQGPEARVGVEDPVRHDPDSAQDLLREGRPGRLPRCADRLRAVQVRQVGAQDQHGVRRQHRTTGARPSRSGRTSPKRWCPRRPPASRSSSAATSTSSATCRSTALIELKNKGFRLQEVGLPTLANISFPGTFMTQGPTSDIRVRQAMSYAINRQEICDTFYKGLAKPGGFWFFSEQTWGFDPTSFKPDPYDPTKAKQLLQEAGYPGKFNPQTITLYTTAVAADLMQILQGYWQAVGVNVDVQVVDTPVYNGLVFVRAKDPTDKQVGAIWPWVNVGCFNNVYHSANMFTSTGVHTTSNDTKADAMYQAATTELDETKAKKLWQDMMHYGYDTMWINVELVEVPTYFAVGPNVGAFTGRTLDQSPGQLRRHPARVSNGRLVAPYQAVQPQSTGSVTPVIMSARGDARNATASAMDSGDASFAMGVRSRTACNRL